MLVGTNTMYNDRANTYSATVNRYTQRKKHGIRKGLSAVVLVIFYSFCMTWYASLRMQ